MCDFLADGVTMMGAVQRSSPFRQRRRRSGQLVLSTNVLPAASVVAQPPLPNKEPSHHQFPPASAVMKPAHSGRRVTRSDPFWARELRTRGRQTAAGDVTVRVGDGDLDDDDDTLSTLSDDEEREEVLQTPSSYRRAFRAKSAAHSARMQTMASVSAKGVDDVAHLGQWGFLPAAAAAEAAEWARVVANCLVPSTSKTLPPE